MKPAVVMDRGEKGTAGGEKVTAAGPIVVEVASNQSPPAINKWRKHVTMAVTAVLVTGIVTAGLVTCAVFFSKTQTQLIKRTVSVVDPSSGQKQDEQVEVDMAHNTSTITVQHPIHGPLTAFNDYNRKLGVVAVHGGMEPYCMVYFLNSTSSATKDANMHDVGVDDEHEVEYLIRDMEPIVTSTFLPPGSPSLCGRVPVYWATTSQDAPPDEPQPDHPIQKRQLKENWSPCIRPSCWCLNPARYYHCFCYPIVGEGRICNVQDR